MDNVTFQDLTDPLTEEVTTYAFIATGEAAYTVMTKAHYEAQQVEHLTEIIPADEA